MKANIISVTHGIRGWFAVQLQWTKYDAAGAVAEGFWVPVGTGFGSYATREEAETEGMIWAAMEGLEFSRNKG